MPASLRAHVSRGMASSSSRPYDRRSPTASPAHLPQSLPPAPPLQDLADPETPPDHPGLPTYADYKRIEAGYLHSLSPRKRDKALITQAMFDKIWDVLHQPEACTIETPQFRFWVRKMFSLSGPMCVGGGGWGEVRVGGTGTGTGTGSGMMYPDEDEDAEGTHLELERAMGIAIGQGMDADADADTSIELFSAVVLHENRPVAIMEQLYELFCYCHVRAGHGGRDKTCAVIRQHYSWVPKELTAQFVKACPTCALKRSGHGGGHGAVSVDMGAVVQRRVGGQKERRVRGTPLEAEGMPMPVVPSSLGSVGWPTTGGPLDPANPEPCGVRERAWLRERPDDGRTIDPSSLPVSPQAARAFVDAGGSRTRAAPREVLLESCLPGGWGSIPQAMAVDASPFHLCNTTTRSLGTTSFPQTFAVHENGRTRSDREEKCSPARTGLPSLASALSNESLDENVNLTGLGPAETAGECLPPVLRPLRLSGPIPSESESDSSHIFQIDPVLLSFNYPGLGLSESGSTSSGADTMPFALPSSTASATSPETLQGRHMTNIAGLCRLRASSDAVDVESLNMPALERSDPSDEHDSPDSSFECAAATFSSLSTELARSTSGCGSRHGYYRDGPFAKFYHCSADEVAQGLDGTFPFSIMTDA